MTVNRKIYDVYLPSFLLSQSVKITNKCLLSLALGNVENEFLNSNVNVFYYLVLYRNGRSEVSIVFTMGFLVAIGTVAVPPLRHFLCSYCFDGHD